MANKLRMNVTVKVSKTVTLRPGAIVEVESREDENAVALVARGFASWVGEGEADTAPEVPVDRILAAIGKLDPENPAHFTKAGKPEVKALSDLLGVEITAKQRDDAWAAVQG
ncbi:hypothetical protein [Azospirillum doebereinerae]|uniref:Uncharacterized protein n=1 Tax=Azospirillum doebereinerae TaxID=92933 RepID=A0A3S0WVJ9_9PROT|nr:hypothetical protein [Azospirillum doebereinerae]RUQ63987.1 hypothetical protein EJ913_27065 [Azospirillum doebereinerae]